MPRHAVLLHPALCFSSGTERLLASARALREQGARVTLVSGPGSRSVAARAAGFDIVELELPGEWLRNAFASLRTRRALLRLRPDILHASDASVAGLARWLAATLDVPYLLELHGAVPGRIPRHEHLCRGVIVPSQALREAAVNRGQVPRALVRVVPHAPDAVDYAGPGPFEGDGPPLIGCAGYLDANLDADWLLDAARLLTLQRIPARFVVLGEGPDEQRLRRRVRKGGMSQHVTIGVPTTAQVGQMLATLDVFVACRIPGPGWLDAEALAQGVPSILAGVGEAFQLVVDGESGVLAQLGDAVNLADELARLLADPAAARAMGQAGKERLRAELSSHHFAVAIAEEHALALGTAKARP